MWFFFFPHIGRNHRLIANDFWPQSTTLLFHLIINKKRGLNKEASTKHVGR
jgi:hypothetical protein